MVVSSESDSGEFCYTESMEINGKELADEILAHCAAVAAILKKDDIVPTLAVIQVGDDPASTSYIRQKQQAAGEWGNLIHEKLDAAITLETLTSTTAHYDNRHDIHAVIVQRPAHIKGVKETVVNKILNTAVDSQKDVDGFRPDSPFEVPVAGAVMTILKNIYERIQKNGLTEKNFNEWCKDQKIVVVGQGETAGKPIIALLQKKGYTPNVINRDMQQNLRDDMLREATVVISCVGTAQKNVIKKIDIQPGVILISVGIWRDADGKLHGDYEVADAIEKRALAYTPTPRGVGPLNVAYLWQNVVWATIQRAKNNNSPHAAEAERLFMKFFGESTS